MSQRSGGGSVSANFAQTWRLSSTPQHDSIRSFKFHPDAGNYRDRRARQEWLQLPFWADSVFKNQRNSKKTPRFRWFLNNRLTCCWKVWPHLSLKLANRWRVRGNLGLTSEQWHGREKNSQAESWARVIALLSFSQKWGYFLIVAIYFNNEPYADTGGSSPLWGLTTKPQTS